MGKIVIACYRPKPGKENALAKLMETHVEILRKEGLATKRNSIIMKAKDGTFVEVFEWVSGDAIEQAHTNPAVIKMWEAFEDACTYEVPVDVEEFHQLFSAFDPFN